MNTLKSILVCISVVTFSMALAGVAPPSSTESDYETSAPDSDTDSGFETSGSDSDASESSATDSQSPSND